MNTFFMVTTFAASSCKENYSKKDWIKQINLFIITSSSDEVNFDR